jgi:hypothetical protein
LSRADLDNFNAVWIVYHSVSFSSIAGKYTTSMDPLGVARVIGESLLYSYRPALFTFPHPYFFHNPTIDGLSVEGRSEQKLEMEH